MTITVADGHRLAVCCPRPFPLFIVPFALFAWLISHQPAVLLSQNKPAIINQPTIFFSQNKPAPAISNQPNEQENLCCVFALGHRRLSSRAAERCIPDMCAVYTTTTKAGPVAKERG
jgi:hypothetical protein